MEYNDRIKNSARNLFWGGLNQVIRIVGPFTLRTIMILRLGNLYLGLNSLFSSILQFLNLTELGFSSAVVYCMYKPIAEHDYEELGKLVVFFKKVYRIIGLIIISIGLLLVPALPNLIQGEYPTEINIYIVYLIYLLNTSLGYFFFGYKSSLLYAFQRSDINSNVNSLCNMVLYILQISILLLFNNYYVYLIVMPIMTLVSNIFRRFWANRILPKIKEQGELDKATKKEIWKRVRALLIYKIGSTVSNSADNLVISVFLGLNLLAIYNNYFLIISTLFNVLTIYYDSIKASIGNSVVVETVGYNYRLFENLLFTQAWLVGFCSIMLTCLYQPFIELWTGAENLFPYEMVILFGVYFYTWKIHDVVHIFKDALGLWHEDRFRPFISSLVNLALNLILVQIIGLYGIVISTILSELVFSLLWAPRTLFRNYFLVPLGQYYKRIVKYTGINLFCGVITNCLCKIMQNHLFLKHGQVSFGLFIILSVLAGALCNLIFLAIYYRTPELKDIKIMLLRGKNHENSF